MTLPVLAIVGRPNVGKSTLFNRLTRSRQALVSDCPGLTRDRQYGRGVYDDHAYWVIDTGGLAGVEESSDPLQNLMLQQVRAAIEEADGILFIVDVKQGLLPQDVEIANHLRAFKKPVWLLVNKVDHTELQWAASDFFKLGLGEPHCIAATHGMGVSECVESVLKKFPSPPQPAELDAKSDISVAVVGRPNVGKSTLINTLLNDNRVIVSETPGTTRDSIHIPFLYRGTHYTLVDTAGVRRRSKVFAREEKFSIVKTLQAIEESQVVIVMLDATEGVVEQDVSLLGLVIQAGKSFVLAVNKWDALTEGGQEKVMRDLDRRLQFATYAKQVLISAKAGIRINNLLAAVEKTYQAATKVISTPVLTRLLERAVTEHQPPLSKGRRIKLRYAHLGGHAPPVIVVHGNQVNAVPDSYKRYLQNYYREQLKLVGTPILLELKEGENPFKGRQNTLTPRQRHKRDRLKRFTKKKKKPR